MITVVQSDVVENAMVTNALHVSHMAGLSHWAKISPRTSVGRSKMVSAIVAVTLCNGKFCEFDSMGVRLACCACLSG
jgi:hypothetical protein